MDDEWKSLISFAPLSWSWGFKCNSQKDKLLVADHFFCLDELQCFLISFWPMFGLLEDSKINQLVFAKMFNICTPRTWGKWSNFQFSRAVDFSKIGWWNPETTNVTYIWSRITPRFKLRKFHPRWVHLQGSILDSFPRLKVAHLHKDSELMK